MVAALEEHTDCDIAYCYTEDGTAWEQHLLTRRAC